MVKKEIIPHLKSSCLALGLTRINDAQPFAIIGSGFFIDEEGFFVTADHVANGMVETREAFRIKGVELEYRGFWFENIDDEHGQLVSIKTEHGREIQINIPELKEFFPENQDLYIGRLSGTGKFPYLNFSKPTKIQVFDEIFMCGYPRGKRSLRTQDQSSGNRFSPILQYGRIASLLPTDHSQNPFGIQTDIIGTGGSSGSPIVDADTEQVLGIAQNVIPASTNVSINDKSASAKIGLVWGISNYFVTDVITKMVKMLKTEFDDNGRPLPDLPDRVSITDKFYPKKLFIKK